MQKLSRSKLYEIEKVSNFKELINRSAKLYPDKVAFTYKKNPKDTTYITHTYTELKEDVQNLGTALIDLGLMRKTCCYYCTKPLWMVYELFSGYYIWYDCSSTR